MTEWSNRFHFSWSHWQHNITKLSWVELSPRQSDKNERRSILEAFDFIFLALLLTLCSWIKTERHIHATLFCLVYLIWTKTFQFKKRKSTISFWWLYGITLDNWSQMNNEYQKSHSEDAQCVSKSAKSLKKNSSSCAYLAGQREHTAEYQAYARKSEWSLSIPQSPEVSRRTFPPRGQ